MLMWILIIFQIIMALLSMGCLILGTIQKTPIANMKLILMVSLFSQLFLGVLLWRIYKIFPKIEIGIDKNFIKFQINKKEKENKLNKEEEKNK